MKPLFAAATALLVAASIPALASQATFERNLTVSGHVELTVNTGSGNIHVTRGSGNSIHIYGKVHSNGWIGDGEDRVREIAANPPIEQTGNIIRIGQHHETWHNISIDYEIQAPADSFLDAGSGSGDVTVDGVGDNAKLSTGSGNIHATGLHGGFTANTGSGDIFAQQTGEGDVRAQTGSGNIELEDIRGGLQAHTGSGNIKFHGVPTMDSKLETGSGNVEVWPGDTGFTLDASTGSGEVHSDPEMSVQGSFNRHHITGKVHGGGPTVRIETGSGDIRIH
jgi:Putative adhesin